ncbi:MAG TPA: 6-carboxytetrahydropterin synthase [bacterium]|nr:6-carboxytetrahydropterin synthase [bacterium]
MYSVKRDIHFSYGHRLWKHPGKCARLHGHNACVQIEISSPGLNQQGMVIDFEKIKETVGKWIQETFDHKMILWKKDPLVPLLKKAGETLVLTEDPPTAEVLAKLIFEKARQMRLEVSKVIFQETEDSSASYHE